LYQHAVTVPSDATRPNGSFDYEASTGRDFAAVADVAGGALMVEQYGILGITEEVTAPLSRGTSVAVVYSNDHDDPSFRWIYDGDLRLAFDPFHAARREGSDPDALLDNMRRLGFNFSPADDPDDPNWVFDDLAPGRAFALAEHVTDVRFTEDTLTEPTFLALSVPAPDQGQTGTAVLVDDTSRVMPHADVNEHGSGVDGVDRRW